MLGLLSGILGGGIPWKLIGGGILISIIGILVWVHLSGDRAKTNKITELNKLITQLEVDKTKLKISNDSLDANNKRQLENLVTVNREYQTLRTVDTTNQIELEQYRKERTSRERSKRIKIIINSREKSLLLRMTNKASNCEWNNYDEFDGRCVAGKYLKKGERLSPLVVETKKDNKK